MKKTNYDENIEKSNKESVEDSDNLIKNINNKMLRLSKSHKKIAKFILEDGDKAVYLTAAKLGAQVNVSESTVVRFAIEVGYDCYQSFQNALEELVKVESSATDRISASSERLKKSKKHILREVLEKDIRKIEKTIELNQEVIFDEIVEDLSNAKRIFILGNRSSSALSNYFSFYLNLMLDDVRLINSSNGSELFEHLMKIREGDVLVVISFPRYSKNTIKSLKNFKNKGATIISVTDGENSPIAIHSHKSLFAKTDMMSLVDSLTSPLSIINAILVSISLKDTDGVISKFEDLESMWREFDVYQTKVKEKYE